MRIQLELNLEKLDRDWVKYQGYIEQGDNFGLYSLEVPNHFTGEGPVPRVLNVTIQDHE